MDAEPRRYCSCIDLRLSVQICGQVLSLSRAFPLSCFLFFVSSVCKHCFVMKSLNTYALDVLGCKVNQYDARQIARLLEGFGLCESKDEPACPADLSRRSSAEEEGLGADLIVVHTCGVTATAVQKSRQTLRRLIRKHPGAAVFLTGCAAGEEVVDGLDPAGGGAGDIDARVAAGPGWIQMLADELQTFSLPNPDFHLPENADELAVDDFGGQTRAFLKIQDGCDAGCAYCIVPHLRKAPRDKSVEAAVAEAKALVKRGYKEIVIAGVHVGLYGRGEDISLSGILSRIAGVSGILSRRSPSAKADVRIRMSSLHPNELTDELLAVWSGNPHIMPHVHLSLQSGSDGVLQRMGRGYTAGEYAAAVGRARAALKYYPPRPGGPPSGGGDSNIPLHGRGGRNEVTDGVGSNALSMGPAITTDVIVGFPGETDEEFEETFEFCKQIGFAQMHIFNFSPRPGTRAADMPNPVGPQAAQARHARLAALADEMSLNFNQGFVGKTVHVLVERCRDGICTGGSEHYIPVKFQGSEELAGTVVPVKIEETSSKELVGHAS